ncbi:MAG TPA: SCO family protein, partial [Rubricoccaceae bacterium]
MQRFAFVFLAFLAGCASRPEHLAPEDDLTDTSWALVDQDSTALAFPGDLAGRPAVVTAVYTHCPDVCLMTMANVKRIRATLGADTPRVAFLTVSFDPARDTPHVLRAYAETWGARDGWQLATGDTASVGSLMRRLGIRTSVAARDTLADGTETVMISHSDKLLLLDGDGRVVETYGGTSAPPQMVADDARA